jgi:hypothetical protein
LDLVMIRWLNPIELVFAMLILASGVAVGLAIGGSAAPESDRPRPETTVGQVRVVDDAQPADSGAAVAAARANLAERLGVDESNIAVVSAESVDWPNSALGCPEPGRAYSQVVTPGYRIVLAVDGATYAYHASRNGSPFYCAEPGPSGSSPIVTGEEPTARAAGPGE